MKTSHRSLSVDAAIFVGVALPTQAATVGYWRFEGNATGFLSDSSGNANILTPIGDAAQATLPTSGNGSKFSDPIPVTGDLQTSGLTHTATTLFNPTQRFNIGATASPASLSTGLLDEVRLSKTKPSASGLLIVPEPGSTGQLGLRRSWAKSLTPSPAFASNSATR